MNIHPLYISVLGRSIADELQEATLCVCGRRLRKKWIVPGSPRELGEVLVG